MILQNYINVTAVAPLLMKVKSVAGIPILWTTAKTVTAIYMLAGMMYFGKREKEMKNKDKKAYAQTMLEAGLDQYSYQAGDVALINLLNAWCIKKLKKRIQLYDIR